MKTNLIPAILLGLFTMCANAQKSDSKASLASFLLFVKEAKQEEAAAVTFRKPGENATSIGRIQQLIKRSKNNQKAPLEIVDGKELGTVARVIVKDSTRNVDGKPDYDGILMVKREGVWKVVLDANEFEDNPRLMDAKERKALSDLKEWQNETMKTLVAASNP